MADLEQSLSALTPEEIDEIVKDVAQILRDLREHKENRRKAAAQKKTPRKRKPAPSPGTEPSQSGGDAGASA